MQIFHNPKCSKSRATLALLRERDIEPEVVEYLVSPPAASELKRILTLLGRTPRELLRTAEAREAGIDHLEGDALVEAMVANPITIERPIVVQGDQAVVGRPPDNVLQLI
jgi:arsenate reductase